MPDIRYVSTLNYSMKKLYFLIISICFLFLSCVNENRFSYVRSLNVKFSGKVSHVKHIDHGFGVVCIDLVEQNYSFYNNELNGYFICKIKNNKAKLLCHVNSISLGDSIIFNPNNNKSYLNFRDGKLIFDNQIIFSSYNWEYLRDEANKINCNN